MTNKPKRQNQTSSSTTRKRARVTEPVIEVPSSLPSPQPRASYPRRSNVIEDSDEEPVLEDVTDSPPKRSTAGSSKHKTKPKPKPKPKGKAKETSGSSGDESDNGGKMSKSLVVLPIEANRPLGLGSRTFDSAGQNSLARARIRLESQRLDVLCVIKELEAKQVELEIKKLEKDLQELQMGWLMSFDRVTSKADGPTTKDVLRGVVEKSREGKQQFQLTMANSDLAVEEHKTARAQAEARHRLVEEELYLVNKRRKEEDDANKTTEVENLLEEMNQLEFGRLTRRA
ncbi:hypothetical protein RhiJN_27460 [Ceratobasidium sp. AG-Ba]|nr:hypothetical protein RhiJN_13393 [Ceratobasidium sp. AG-Ba]QRV99441.1 hypothetical protein RhiJN_27460 [Ceratobasidium sp. AG-Ba]QRW13949.1 hypothetical protein RhiLY_12948 [Ceratobasidium sp. AG-Ba]